MKRFLALAAILLASPAAAASLRQNYENCVTNTYMDLIVDGRPIARLTAEQAIQGCETELQALYSLLVDTNMAPKMAFSMVSTIRLSAKRRLLTSR